MPLRGFVVDVPCNFASVFTASFLESFSSKKRKNNTGVGCSLPRRVCVTVASQRTRLCVSVGNGNLHASGNVNLAKVSKQSGRGGSSADVRVGEVARTHFDANKGSTALKALG